MAYTLEIDYSAQSGYGNWFGNSSSYLAVKGGFTVGGTGFQVGQFGVWLYRTSGVAGANYVTAYLFSESGGNPSAQLQTSINTINVSAITTTIFGVEYLFQFAGYDLTASTKYFIVLLASAAHAVYPRFVMGASGTGWNYSAGRGTFPVSGGGSNLTRLRVYSQPAAGGSIFKPHYYTHLLQGGGR
jgi:hypothetical protein